MSPRAKKLLRILAMLSVLALLYVGARATGLSAYAQPAELKALVARSGAWGASVFVLVFVAAVVAQVPGFVFVLVAPALFSWWKAWLLCTLASNLAVLINFELVRRVGGQPFTQAQRPWMQRVFASLDERPIRAVIVLRIVTIMFPPVTSALALTKLGARDHAIGSFLGMLLPISALIAVGALFSR